MRSTGKPRCFTPSFRLLAITLIVLAANLNLRVCLLHYLFGILFIFKALAALGPLLDGKLALSLVECQKHTN